MYKTFALALLVSTLVTACGQAVPGEAPVRERTFGQSGAGVSRQVLPADKYRTGTYLGKSDPAKHGTTGIQRPEAAVGGAAAAATTPAADTPVVATTPSYLAIAKEEADMTIAAVMSDAGVVEELLFSPASGTMTWKVKAAGGEAPVNVKTVKLTLQATATYPPREDSEASGTMPASELKSTAETPVSVELDTAALGWQGPLASGSEASLALKLDTEAIRDYLASIRGIAKLSVRLEFLSADGKAVLNEKGQPFTVKATVQVL